MVLRAIDTGARHKLLLECAIRSDVAGVRSSCVLSGCCTGLAVSHARLLRMRRYDAIGSRGW